MTTAHMQRVSDIVHEFAQMSEAELGEQYEAVGLDATALRDMGNFAQPGTGTAFGAGVLVGVAYIKSLDPTEDR